MDLFIGVMFAQLAAGFLQGRARARELAGQETIAKFNARVADADAVAAQRKTDFDQMLQLRESERALGRLRVAQGASGARTDVGQPLANVVAQEAELELDRFLIGLEGRTQVSKFKTEAGLQRLQAKIFGKGAKTAILTGVLGGAAAAGGTLATGVGAGVFATGGPQTTSRGFATGTSATATAGAGRF